MAAFTPVTDPLPFVGDVRGPSNASLVSVAAGTLATATASQEFSCRGGTECIEVVIDFTKVGAAPSVVPSIEGFDPVSKKWFTLLTGAALIANGQVQLLVGPSVPNVANISAAHIVRSRMRLTMTHANTDTATYSVTVAAYSD